MGVEVVDEAMRSAISFVYNEHTAHWQTCFTPQDHLNFQRILSNMARNFAIIGLCSSVLSLVGATETKDEICMTPACVKAAAHVLDNLHPDYESIDPCKNFDQCAQILFIYSFLRLTDSRCLWRLPFEISRQKSLGYSDGSPNNQPICSQVYHGVSIPQVKQFKCEVHAQGFRFR